jgi:hypothetical protein
MSQTLQWRVDRTKALARKLNANLTIPEQMIRLNVHLGRNDAYMRYLPQAEHLFRKSISIADGANLPNDYVKYAENATYTTSGSTYSFSYIPAEKISSVKTQPMFKAYGTDPKLAIYDGKVHTFPTGITIDNWEYYWHPVDLFASDNSIPLTTQDNMPQETEFAIVRGAFERSLRMQLGHDAMVEFLEKNRNDIQVATAEFYRDVFGAELADLQVNKL